MPTTRHQARISAAKEARESPTWDCENGSLESGTESGSASEIRHSPVNSSPTQSPEPPPSVFPEDKQLKNAKNPNWQPWQDRYLAAEVLKHRPFLQPRSATYEAWERLAAELAADSKKSGPFREINRSGAACRARFTKILKAHQREETRSLQKSGANEGIDEHIENMTNLAALVDETASEKAEKSSKARKKDEIEKAATLEIPQSAMKGLVDSQKLTDIGQLEGATVREKQGQRKCKHSNESDKENTPVKRPRSQSAIANALQEHQRKDEKLLADARAREDARQQEMMDGLNKVTQSIDSLAEKQKQDSLREMKLLELVNTLAQKN
ncbi:hypothetical protein M422DRAFT_268295 [Sphaerobolus stellatus SS14]|uniref:Myb-like domain-containing protein n=1 Tax=Sphaerobolus stellatus (strain SS14) TaxID=990650 RepID=A0A0C9U7A8_SPHS4|nr:hypothetical protein M422DRAFT_268295 [Sphaerobolus stellatus SS14]